jgi:hypothetical protein
MRIKHSKYKNTGILFELLVRQITTDTLENNPSPARDILQKYFVKSELGKEYKLYESLTKRTNLSEAKAGIVVSTLLENVTNLNRGALKRQKYNLISEIKKHYDLDIFFGHQLPNYKTYAAFYTLLEMEFSPTKNHDQIIQNRVTLLEHLSTPLIKTQDVEDEVLNEFNNSDKDTKLLTYRIMIDKFNNKYENLSTEQKSILKEYINSIDNNNKLKDFFTQKINEIKEDLEELNMVTDHPHTKIKINEIISMINPPSKTSKVKDNDLIDLLQYCDLVTELKSIHGTT